MAGKNRTNQPSGRPKAETSATETTNRPACATAPAAIATMQRPFNVLVWAPELREVVKQCGFELPKQPEFPWQKKLAPTEPREREQFSRGQVGLTILRVEPKGAYKGKNGECDCHLVTLSTEETTPPAGRY